MMTLHERYDATKQTIDGLTQERAQLQAAMNQNMERLIRADAEMALLEQLIKDETRPADLIPAPDTPEPKPALAVVRRGRKKADQAEAS